ncbi:MAG: Hpt domain-containing response regulator, partial [Shewanella sp.]
SQLLGINLLLVEDNVLNQELATELLRQAGATVILANNGQEALDCLAQQSVDCVLMDGQMPIMDGYEATRRIRAQPQFASLPIIAMTANAMVTDVDKALAAGMSAQINKPIKVNELYSTIRQWVDIQALAAVGHKPETEEIDAANSDFPQIAGLDIAAGLALCNDNPALYQHLLTLFVQTGANLLENQQQALLQADSQAMLFSLHTLNGVAGNIGATGIRQAAALAEAQLINLMELMEINSQDQASTTKSQAPLDVITPDIVQLHADLQRLLTALAQWQAASQPDNVTQPISMTALLTLLTQLELHLKEYNADALSLVDQLSRVSALQPKRQLLEELKQAAGQFDFSLALERLITLRTWAEKHLNMEC